MREFDWDTQWTEVVATALGVPEETAKDIAGLQMAISDHRDCREALVDWKTSGGMLNTILVGTEDVKQFSETLDAYRYPYFAAFIVDHTGNERAAFIIRSAEAPMIENICAGYRRDAALVRENAEPDRRQAWARHGNECDKSCWSAPEPLKGQKR